MYRVGAIQINTTSNKDENLAKIQKYVEEAAHNQCKFVVFPELFNCMVSKEQMKNESEDESGKTLTLMKNLAQKYNMYIAAGSILYINSTLSLPQNKSFLCSPDGTIVAEYAKMHLFDIDIPGKVTHFESQRIAPGENTSVVDTSMGKIGLAICYDLRFPELFSKLRQEGASIIILPAAFTYETGKAHWEILIRARAIENQVFIIAPDQCGKLPIGIEAYGNSMIVDPWGKILARAGEQEAIIYADLDMEYLKQIRRNMPVWQHKKLI